MADTEQFYDDLIIINLYHMRSAEAHDDLALFFKRKYIFLVLWKLIKVKIKWPLTF